MWTVCVWYMSVEALNQFQKEHTHAHTETPQSVQLLVKSLVVHKKVNRQTNKQHVNYEKCTNKAA